MFFSILLLGALCATTFSTGRAATYEKTGKCEVEVEKVYKYKAVESYFGKTYEQTFNITITFNIICLSVGKYGNHSSTLFALIIKKTEMGGNVLARSDNPDTDVDFSGWFQFVQTEDGTIPLTLYSREEDANIINIKKAIVSAFQSNFHGKAEKEESDPQSQHKSQYSFVFCGSEISRIKFRETAGLKEDFVASAQDKSKGVMTMQRKINSTHVVGYAQHIPNEEVELNKVEHMEYHDAELIRANGTVSCKLMTEDNISPATDSQSDSLENERQQPDKRDTSPSDPNKIETQDNKINTNNYESNGFYALELVTVKRRLRHRRSVDHSNMPNAVMSSLLAFIDQTRKVMVQMMEIHNFLGNIREALTNLHENPNNTAIAHKLEKLIKLEAEYGQALAYPPAISDVLGYLQQLLGSNRTRDTRMRYLIYFIITPDGSISSQMAMLDSWEKVVNNEEKETLIMYISVLANPQPRFVARLEHLISNDVHSSDPLLLAYGALLPRASSELQHRMILYLFNRLPQAEKKKTSLIHHILSLGNTASPNMSRHLLRYLGDSELDVQLSAILAMRFIMDEAVIHKSLKDFVSGSKATDDHLIMITKALLYGTERAKYNNKRKPYSSDFAEELVASALRFQNGELFSSLGIYLQAINTKHSMTLLHYMQKSNTTRFRRGSKWSENKNEYNLVEPLADRKIDAKNYPTSLSFIWGKSFGGHDINVKVAAGAFAGVNSEGSYKLFGHAVAKAQCYDYTLTMLEFLVMRKKNATSTVSDLYAIVMGNTVKKVHETEDSTVCKTIDKPVYEAKDYTIFDFTYSVFVVVGTLDFRLNAYAQFTTGLYVEFCENQGRITAGAGLSPTITLTVAATGDLEVALVAKAGLTLSATFNYQLLPEVTSDMCYKNNVIQVRNCIGVYHQWEDNKIDLYAWYAWRGWCGWFVCTGKDAYKKKHKIDKLSFTWNLPGTKKLTIWKACDKVLKCD